MNIGTVTQSTMNDGVAIWLVIAGSIAIGFAWGRLSYRLRIPELLQLLCTPILTSILAAVLGWGFILARYEPTALAAQAFATLPLALAARVAAGYSYMFLVAGFAFGLPAVLGWAIGYRRRATP